MKPNPLLIEAHLECNQARELAVIPNLSSVDKTCKKILTDQLNSNQVTEILVEIDKWCKLNRNNEILL